MRKKIIFWLLTKSLLHAVKAIERGHKKPGFIDLVYAKLIWILTKRDRSAIDEYCDWLSEVLGFKIEYDNNEIRFHAKEA